MTRIYPDITQTVGNTPLVRVNNLTKDLNANILVKLEYFNPLSSVKDRIGVAMIDQAEKDGKLNPQSVIIEPTSGNTGIALAFVAAAKGYRLILIMPDTMSIERRKLFKILGAELVLTEGSKGMNGAIQKARELVANTPHAFMPQQFENEANPKMHKRTTAIEIWNDTDGEIDYLVAGVGTGGTITGIGEFLKSKNESIKIIAVEPEASAVLSGEKPSQHKIQGIGAGFIPKVLNCEIIDEIIKVSNENAGKIARQLAKEDGIFVGISSGAAMWTAMEIAKRKEACGKNMIVILPDSGERYLSTWLFDE